MFGDKSTIGRCADASINVGVQSIPSVLATDSNFAYTDVFTHGVRWISSQNFEWWSLNCLTLAYFYRKGPLSWATSFINWSRRCSWQRPCTTSKHDCSKNSHYRVRPKQGFRSVVCSQLRGNGPPFRVIPSDAHRVGNKWSHGFHLAVAMFTDCSEH